MNVPNKYYQLALKLHQFLKVNSLNEVDNEKINNIIDDLRYISDLNFIWDFDLLLETYKDVLLNCSMYALISKIDTLINFNINVNNKNSNTEKIHFYINEDEWDFLELIQKKENNVEIANLKNP